MAKGELSIPGDPRTGRLADPLRDSPADLRAPVLPRGWWIVPGIALGLAFWMSLFWLLSLWS